jgi:Carboxypeptidase regulatory-like domain
MLKSMAPVLVPVAFLAFSTSAFAQATASIAGTVVDASGAVLPGVTVEASSPALIEKQRAVVTDGTGQYRIEQLRGGTYTVTFTLTGFSTVRREGVELSGSFSATVNAEMKLGSVEETITVTGDSPVVDIQSSQRQRVIDQELLVAIPTGRTPQVAAFLIPGVNLSNVDVGGTNIINTTGGSMSIHGGRVDDTRLLIDGITIANTEGTGWSANMLPNMGSTQEVSVDYSSVTAESITGGLQINMIPKTGGNSYSGTLFATAVNSAFEGTNTNDELVARGLRTPNSLKLQYDVNPGLGGPLKEDRLWFYTSARFTRQSNYIGGLFQNQNAFDITKWAYVPDEAQRAFSNAAEQSLNLRLTWQVNALNKFSGFYDQHWRCQCRTTAATVSQEAAHELEYPISDLTSIAWTATPSNRVLVEARWGVRREEYAYSPHNLQDPDHLLIPVIEQAGLIPGLLYRGGGLQNATQAYQRTLGVSMPSSAALSYVTGSHSAKVGFYNVTAQRTSWVQDNASHLTYQFNNGVPNQLTQRATPLYRAERQKLDLGIYVQDKWTVRRLTLSGGFRFDTFQSYFPEQTLAPGPLVPNRSVTFPKTDMANWKDIVPRFGTVYDVRGNGKTALKMSINKYVTAQGLQGTYGDTANPVNRMANIVSRSWIDTDRDFVPDCDLTNVLVQDFRPTGGDLCGTVSDTNFGRQTLSLSYDPDVLNGWGSRPYQWEFSTSVQHELQPRLSIDVGYFRRWFGNFGITDNLNLRPADYGSFSVTAPIDPRLPDGGGYTTTGFYNLNPDKVAVAPNNYFTFAKNYGKQTEHWNGVDVTLNWRLPASMTIQGGVSTGQRDLNTCDVVDDLPEAAVLTTPYCHQKENFLTDGKLVWTYTIPKVDVSVSGLFYSRPGPQLSANQVIPNSVVRESLGRDLSANAQNVTVNLVQPGAVFGERRNQLDLRVTKPFMIDSLRLGASFELYNAFNANTVLTESTTYRDASLSGWRIPTGIMPPRFIKLSLQMDF